jgi:DNA topoisomerase VI subunit B
MSDVATVTQEPLVSVSNAPEAKSTTPIRHVFTTSRLLEFCSVKELTAQTGHGPNDWPRVVVKELVDNALDACEEHGIAPQITIGIKTDSLMVADNGAGLSAETITKVIDYSVRASSREAFVAPTRGAQGNALKTIIAMPYALDGNVGTTMIEAHRVRLTITFKANQVRQEPVITVDQDRSFVRNGTHITVRWPEIPRSELNAGRDRILQIAEDYSAFNPHLTLQVTIDGKPWTHTPASNQQWRRWQPSDPPTAYWYEPDTFERLIAAYVRDDQDRGRNTLVREFVSQFRGLTGSAKQKAVLDSVGAARMTLANFFGSGDAINKKQVVALLEAVKTASRPVKPLDLGFVGEDHLRQHLTTLGALPDTIRYKRVVWDDNTRPFVVEAAFGYCDNLARRRLAIGLNFSPAIGNPIRGLEDYLDKCWVGLDDQVVIALHITCPRFAFTDRGKGSIVLPSPMGNYIADAIQSVTKEWTKQSKAEHREASARARRIERLTRRRKVSIKEAAYAVMARAYLEASAGGTLPATATQIMYAARGQIQGATGKQLNRQYFNQTLLPAFLEDHPEMTAQWDVTYDDRGRLIDPHTDETIGLGTKSVRQYLARVGDPEFRQPNVREAGVITRGPHGGYGSLFYIEKEGFLDLLNHVQLAQRYDIAIMSCKGTSVTAARRLADRLCHTYRIPLFVLHDFDKAGLTILGTLRRDTHRYSFENDIQVIDLGLRLEDIEQLGIEERAEDVFDRGQDEKRAANMRKNGATDAEIQFLLRRRVELNALPSDRLVRFIEDKLQVHGVKKIVPDGKLLGDAFQLFHRGRQVEAVVEHELARIQTTDCAVPANLDELVRAELGREPTLRWDAAVRRIVEGGGS